MQNTPKQVYNNYTCAISTTAKTVVMASKNVNFILYQLYELKLAVSLYTVVFYLVYRSDQLGGFEYINS